MGAKSQSFKNDPLISCRSKTLGKNMNHPKMKKLDNWESHREEGGVQTGRRICDRS